MILAGCPRHSSCPRPYIRRSNALSVSCSNCILGKLHHKVTTSVTRISAMRINNGIQVEVDQSWNRFRAYTALLDMLTDLVWGSEVKNEIMDMDFGVQNK